MRAFVTGTGRCGTKTFARACSHLTTHTSGHETHRGKTSGYLDYPEDHIEVDPHLSFMLPRLVDRYPDALFVHLWRPEDEVVASWKRRGIKERIGAAPLVAVIFQIDPRYISPERYDEALRELYRNVTAGIESTLSGLARFQTDFSIYEAPEVWAHFCGIIGADGDHDAALRTLRERH